MLVFQVHSYFRVPILVGWHFSYRFRQTLDSFWSFRTWFRLDPFFVQQVGFAVCTIRTPKWEPVVGPDGFRFEPGPKSLSAAFERRAFHRGQILAASRCACYTNSGGKRYIETYPMIGGKGCSRVLYWECKLEVWPRGWVFWSSVGFVLPFTRWWASGAFNFIYCVFVPKWFYLFFTTSLDLYLVR